jgi:hypothetical protein
LEESEEPQAEQVIIPPGFEPSEEDGAQKKKTQFHVTLPPFQAQVCAEIEDSLEKTETSLHSTPLNSFHYKFPKQQISKEEGPRATFT